MHNKIIPHFRSKSTILVLWQPFNEIVLYRLTYLIKIKLIKLNFVAYRSATTHTIEREIFVKILSVLRIKMNSLQFLTCLSSSSFLYLVTQTCIVKFQVLSFETEGLLYWFFFKFKFLKQSEF